MVPLTGSITAPCHFHTPLSGPCVPGSCVTSSVRGSILSTVSAWQGMQ